MDKYNLSVHILLQFVCSGGDTTKVIEVEADEMNRGITTLCGFPPNTKVTCSAQAGNSAGFSGFASKSVDTTSEDNDTVPCKYIFVMIKIALTTTSIPTS